MANKKKEIKDPSEINVKLKKIVGISPRLYIPAIYITGILLLVYIVLFNPGVTRGGTLFTIEGNPTSVTVFVDDKRHEASPTPFYVLKGERTFTISKPGFKEETFTRTVKGRLFASRFFPRKETININLELENHDIILDNAYSEWAHWIQTGEPQLFYPVPLILTPAAQDIYRAGSSEINSQIKPLLGAAFQHSNHPVFIKDLIKSLMIEEAGGSVLSIDSLSSAMAEISDYISRNPNSVYLLAGSASMGDAPEEISELLLKKVKPVSSSELTPLSSNVSGSRIIGNVKFIEIPSGSYVMGADKADQFPHIEKIDTFYIQETEVSQALFQEFLTDSNTSLNDYIFKEENAELPMSGINYYDALAFTQWFSSRYCEQRGYKAVIPTEVQWERAAKVNFNYSSVDEQIKELLPVSAGKKGLAGLIFMDGNLWEWTRDDYRPLSHFFTKENSKYESGIKTVKGGCYVNAPDGVSPSARGSQPAEFRTPFLGFRMALERIK